MSLLKELVNLKKTAVKEMDFEFGGTRPQPGPDTTDGPMPNGDDMEGYKDFQAADDTAEYDSPLEGEDHIEMEIPFLIKMLEWAREEAQDDEVLHKAVENMLALDKSPLTMDDYDQIIPEAEGVEGMGDEMGGETTNGDHPESGMPLRNADTTQNNNDKVFRMK